MKIVSLVFAANLLAAFPALAQQPPAPPPSELPPATGPQVPGLCLLSYDGLYAGSVLGQFIESRLNNIAAQTNAELTEAGRPLDAERTNLRAQVTAQGQEAMAAQVEAFNVRAAQFQQLIELRASEIERTRQLAQIRFGDEARPVAIQVRQSRSCSVVLEMDATVFPDQRADITPDVITALNARITQFPIEKAVIQPPVAGQPGAATP